MNCNSCDSGIFVCFEEKSVFLKVLRKRKERQSNLGLTTSSLGRTPDCSLWLKIRVFLFSTPFSGVLNMFARTTKDEGRRWDSLRMLVKLWKDCDWGKKKGCCVSIPGPLPSYFVTWILLVSAAISLSVELTWRKKEDAKNVGKKEK